MSDEPNFVLIPDDAPQATQIAKAKSGGLLARLRAMVTTAVTAAPSGAAALHSFFSHAGPPVDNAAPVRPRLVFAVDATASREPAWAAARQVTDSLVKCCLAHWTWRWRCTAAGGCIPSPPSPTTLPPCATAPPGSGARPE